MSVISARAPCRIDLAGGTLDIWPLGLLHQGARTVNLAIDVEVRVELSARPSGYLVRQGREVVETAEVQELDSRPSTSLVGLVMRHFELPPVEVAIDSSSPRGAGLGASSALTVALISACRALLEWPVLAPRECAHLARDFEARLMSLPTGTQDHYPALIGGALEIVAAPGGEQVRSLAVELDSVGDHLTVVFSGQSHFSAANNWQIVRRRLDGDPEVVRLMSGIAEVACDVAVALEALDLAAVGALMSREWSYRRQLSEVVSSPRVEELLDIARKSGAWGGKACGAGGGGCVAILGPVESRPELVRRLVEAGGDVLDVHPTSAGLTVENR